MPAKRRQAILAGAATRAAHAALLEALPGLGAVETAPLPAHSAHSALQTGRAGPAPAALRVVAWNVERGRDPEALAALLRRDGADAALLSELDWGMARSGQRNVARELAERLGLARAFGVEFLELSLGDAAESAACEGRANEVGYHGNAVLAAVPLERVALVRLEARGAWFGSERGQRRVGGRCAVLAEVRLAGGPVTLAAVHLESHSDPHDRAEQMRALLDALDDWTPGAPALVGGDLNTFSLAIRDVGRPERVSLALAEDPARWSHPVPHEPLFAVAEAAGFDWRACNVAGVATHRVPAAGGGSRGSQRGAFKLDWMLARGLRASGPAVLEAVDPGSGEALSDHEAVAVTIEHA